MCSHREVDRRHNLIAHFDNRNGNARMMQVFGHFKPDKSCSHHNGAFHLIVRNVGLDQVGILHIAKRKYAFRMDAFQRRLHRSSSRRQQKFIISFLVFFSASFADSQCFAFRINGNNLILHSHINAETLSK